MSERFFTPYVGPKYNDGICGKKVLVVGASFYCDKNGERNFFKCPFFEKCTNPEIKNSEPYNLICPVYSPNGYKLQDEPTLAIENCYKAYKTFASFFSESVDNPDEGYSIWDRLAYTNYVQFFVPPKETKPSYLSERDLASFYETLRELTPDVVITWGVVFTEEIRMKNEFVSQTEKNNLLENEYYVWHMKLPEMEREITIINCFHPSCPKKWNAEKDIFKKYIRKVFSLK